LLELSPGALRRGRRGGGKAISRRQQKISHDINYVEARGEGEEKTIVKMNFQRILLDTPAS
jgi:hypothetical protein